jgi:hypothetical protein
LECLKIKCIHGDLGFHAHIVPIYYHDHINGMSFSYFVTTIFFMGQVKNHTNVNIRIKDKEKEHTPIFQCQTFPNPKDYQISIYKSCLNHRIQIIVCICLSHYMMAVIETSSSHKPNKNCHQQNTNKYFQGITLWYISTNKSINNCTMQKMLRCSHSTLPFIFIIVNYAIMLELS